MFSNHCLTETERCKVVITECIYYADITPLNVLITTELLKCHIQSYTGEDDLDYEFNNYTGDTLLFNIKDKWNIPMEQFAITGNPPYNTDPSYKGNKPLYNKFIEKYINGKFLLFVVPSRWFVSGKGLDKFRGFMLKRQDIVFIKHVDNSSDFFGKIVKIMGGVNYFLKDSSYCEDCLFNNKPYDLSKYEYLLKPKYHELVDFISKMDKITTIYKGRFFGIESNDKRLIPKGRSKCYVSTLRTKDRYKYIDNYEFNENTTFWKVITSKCNPTFLKAFIVPPDEIHSGSYISLRVNNEDEATSLLSFLNTKFVNYMLSVCKITQNISENTCKYIPLVPLDRIWTEEKVLEYLKIPPHLYIL